MPLPENSKPAMPLTQNHPLPIGASQEAVRRKSIFSADDKQGVACFSPALSSVQFDAVSFSHRSRGMTKVERANLIDRACKLWEKGDPSGFAIMPWISGFTLKQKPKITPRFIPNRIRQDVLAVGLCAHCGSTKQLSVDHIQPLARGGTHDRKNLQCLCLPCNTSKGYKWEEATV